MVASDPPDAAVTTPQRHGGIPSAPKRDDYVPFVASWCIKRLQLATTDLLENLGNLLGFEERTRLCVPLPSGPGKRDLGLAYP